MNDDYIVRDGDIILSTDGFIFYAVGYDHPEEMAISYLKYIPQEYKERFPLKFINNIWYHDMNPYIRPKQLYSPENFKIILQSFKKYFPQYLFSSDKIQKDIFVVPFERIRHVFVPKSGLQDLINRPNKDDLEKFAIELITFLSDKSQISLNKFGLHGSLLTGMHSPQSDVDIGVYDQENYHRVKETVKELVEKKEVNYLFEIESDKWRFNKCEYKGKKFVFNAIRELNQVKNRYNYVKYVPKHVIRGVARVSDVSDSSYRPAIYNIVDFKGDSENIIPSQVVSMIGEYRDIAKLEQIIEFRGLLEKVLDLQSNKATYRVFIGSENDGEYIRPII